MQKLLSQNDSTSILEKYNIETPKQEVIRSLKDLVIATKKIGFPIFMKIDSPDISHKTDLKLVSRADNLKDAINEFTRIIESSKSISKNINGVLVQEFVEGSEFIIGIKTDPTFGKVVMFGTGGIYAEIFKDVSFRICPIDENEALKMIKETKGFQIMHSRGKHIDENKIAKVLSSISNLAIKENIEGMDINPFIAGSKYVAADVKILERP